MKLGVYFALCQRDWGFKYWFKSFSLVMLENAVVCPLLYCIAEHSTEELQFCCSPGGFASLCYVQHRDGQDLWSVAASTSCSSSQNPCSLMMWLEAHRTCLAQPLSARSLATKTACLASDIWARNWACRNDRSTSGCPLETAVQREARAYHFTGRSWGIVMKNSRGLMVEGVSGSC